MAEYLDQTKVDLERKNIATREKMGDKEAEPSVTIKQQCVKCFQGPNCIKTIVVLICLMVVVQQIISCIQKLIDKPITTYTHFDYNQTIAYPSITFCREPAYKEDKLMEYGLYSHPRYTSTWRSFNFSSISLDDLWEEITYTEEDFFVQYGLDNLKDNVQVTSTLCFIAGRCHTLSPKALDMRAKATQEYGYSITLKHFASDLESPTSLLPPGYHVYIHYIREPYTEIEVYNGGLVDYLYINTGETVSVKLKVDEYIMISNEDDPCTYAVNYSANNCTTQYVTELVGEQVGCSGPWMNSPLPYCDNFEDMRSLISTYIHLHHYHDCQSCPRFCRSFLYTAFVTDRQRYYLWNSQDDQASHGDANLQTTIYFHFNNMMVSVYEETYNYDWNVFISDLGGSISLFVEFDVIQFYGLYYVPVRAWSIVRGASEELYAIIPLMIQMGFLLGLSVVGLINIMGYIWMFFIRPFICRRSKKNNSIDVPPASNNQSVPKSM